MIADLSDVVSLLSSGTYTVTRRALSTIDANGLKVAGSASTLSVGASVQPTNGRDLQRLEEGRRTVETLTIYTSTLLQTQSATGDADRLSVNGVDYEVATILEWNALGNYCKALAQKVSTR